MLRLTSHLALPCSTCAGLDPWSHFAARSAGMCLKALLATRKIHPQKFFRTRCVGMMTRGQRFAVSWAPLFHRPLVDLNPPWPSARSNTHTQVLNTMSFSKGVVLTNRCSVAFRKYSCAVHFPTCTTDGTDVAVTGPCRSVCEEYCSECKLSHCPCSDLPPDGNSCRTLASYCPMCAADATTSAPAGRCEVNEHSRNATAVADATAGQCDWANVERAAVESGSVSVHSYSGKALTLAIAIATGWATRA